MSRPTDPPVGQLPLVPAKPARRRRRPDTAVPDADVDPVASVAVDLPLAHLDRPFDYRVPAHLAASAVPGVRVRVRFAGQDVGGFVLSRAGASSHAGRLTPLTRVVSDVPVLTPTIAALARAVADRYAGTLADVLRAAVPPRHARAESAPPADTGAGSHAPIPPEDPGPWSAYSGGPALCLRVGGQVSGPAPRAVWTALPGEDPATAFAVLAHHALAAGRGALLLAPDGRDVDRLAQALRARVGQDRCEVLTADLGPAARYRAFLRVLRGEARAVVGTRAAAFAPVADLGLIAVWDDGDDLHAEPHAPYWHAREVAALRSTGEGAALVLGGFARSVEAAQWVASGWTREVVPSRTAARRQAPLCRVAADDAALARDPLARSARLPHIAWDVARTASTTGPVLVQVPRRGYLPALACRRCRAPARCRDCGGPLASATGPAVTSCTWCARAAVDWTCPSCGSREFRAARVGARRTAEELGRAFPGVPVVTSGRDSVLATVPNRPSLVVSTPGAEPVADGGYVAALLLDGDQMLSRPDMRAEEEAARRWFNAVALVRGRDDGGTVVVVADPAAGAVQALLRHDAPGLAERERVERSALGLPPAVRAAELTGVSADVADLLAVASLPPEARVLGPAPVAGEGRPRPDSEARVRAVITVPLETGDPLCRALQAAAGVRSARKTGGPVAVRIDPVRMS